MGSGLGDYIMKARGNWDNYTPTGAVHSDHDEDDETDENKEEKEEPVQSRNQDETNQLYDLGNRRAERGVLPYDCAPESCGARRSIQMMLS